MGANALCPRHPNLNAARTCTRCGTFMCDICSEDGTETMCLDCRERTGLKAFPFDRGNWSFSGLWDYSWNAFQRDWLMLALGALVLFGISFVVQIVAGMLPLIGRAMDNTPLTIVLQAMGMATQVVVQGVLTLGYIRMCADVIEGQKADIGKLFSQLHKTGTYFVTMLLVVLMIAIPMAVVFGGLVGMASAMGLRGESMLIRVILPSSLVLIGPALYFVLPLYMLQPAIALRENVSAMETIRHCYAVARGERLSILGVGFVSGLVMLAGFIACCVGFLPAMGLAQLLMVGLYLALRNEGSDFES
jgi:hypothetical protein